MLSTWDNQRQGWRVVPKWENKQKTWMASWGTFHSSLSKSQEGDTGEAPSGGIPGLQRWTNIIITNRTSRTSLVAQWLRIHLPVPGTQVRALVREDATCHGATKPVSHNYWACALELMSHNYWACVPRAHAPQHEKPPQWEARAPQRRVAPAHRN